MEDINACTARKLTSFIGISPRIANEVVKYRRKRKRFLHIDELWRVKGMTRPLFRLMVHNFLVKNKHDLKVGEPLPYAHTNSTVSKPLSVYSTQFNDIKPSVMPKNRQNNIELKPMQPAIEGSMHVSDRCNNIATMQPLFRNVQCPLDLTLPKNIRSQRISAYPERNTPVPVSAISENYNSKVAGSKQIPNYTAEKGSAYFNDEVNTNELSRSKFLNNLDLILNPIMLGKTASGEGVVITYKSNPKQRSRSAHPVQSDVRDKLSPGSRHWHAASHKQEGQPIKGEVLRMSIRSKDDLDTRVSRSASGSSNQSRLTKNYFDSMQVYPPVTSSANSTENKLTQNNIQRMNGGAADKRTGKQDAVKEWLSTVHEKKKPDNRKNDPTLAVYRHVSKRAKNSTSRGRPSTAVGPYIANFQPKATGIPHISNDSTKHSTRGELQNQSIYRDQNAANYDNLYKHYERRRGKSNRREIAYPAKIPIRKNMRKRRKKSNASDTNQRSSRQREKVTQSTATTSRKGNKPSNRPPAPMTTRNKSKQRKVTENTPDTKKNQRSRHPSAERRADESNKARHTKRRQTTGSKHHINRGKHHKSSTRKDEKPPSNDKVQRNAIDCSIL